MAEEPPEETLGQRIRRKRKEQGWSQDDLAEEVGTSSLTVMRWELDRSFPRGDEVQQALIEVLDLPKNEFTKIRMKKQARKDEEGILAKKGEDEEEVSPVEKVEKGGLVFPINMILPNQHWSIPIPSPEELEDMDVVEYTIPPIIVYRGFHFRIYDEKYGYVDETRVTSDGKRLLPYETWMNPDTVVYGWGHTGSGPRHLAASILLDYFETMYSNEQEDVLRSWAYKYSYNFKMDFTAWFDKREWKVWSGAITAWLKEQRENGDPAPEHTLMDIDDGWLGWWKRWDKYRGV